MEFKKKGIYFGSPGLTRLLPKQPATRRRGLHLPQWRHLFGQLEVGQEVRQGRLHLQRVGHEGSLRRARSKASGTRATARRAAGSCRTESTTRASSRTTSPAGKVAPPHAGQWKFLDGNLCDGHYQQKEKEDDDPDDDEDKKKDDADPKPDGDDDDDADKDQDPDDDDQPDDNQEEKKKFKLIWHSSLDLLGSARRVKEIQALE